MEATKDPRNLITRTVPGLYPTVGAAKDYDFVEVTKFRTKSIICKLGHFTTLKMV